MASKKPLIVDCDTGIDDALALLYLLLDPEVEIHGVTTVFGNTSPERAADNSLRVLELVGRGDIPVAIGARTTSTGRVPALAPFVHGHDGLGNTGLPAPTGTPSAEPAAQAVVRLAREHPGQLHLLATGPLTNLATALLLEPDLPGLIRRVTVMGGAIHHPGNATAVAEANIHNDPEAARAVFGAGWDITLVPLDVTMTEVLTAEVKDRLQQCGERLTAFAASILEHYLDFYEKTVFGHPGAACHDPLAAAIAVGDVAPLRAPTVSVDVETGDGPARGAVVADMRGQYREYPPQDGARVRVVLETPRTFAGQLADRLCTSPIPRSSSQRAA